MTRPKQRSTRTIRASIGADRQHGSVMPPLYLSSTFSFAGFEQKREYDYTRTANPTRDALSTALADLEGGAGATVTSSGMAAINLVCQLLGPGDLLIAPHDCYGGTYRLLDALDSKGQLRVRFVDQTDTRALRKAFAERPRMILVETPSNPLLRVVDIEAVCGLAKHHDTLVVADNTFLSPVLQRPLELGADIVLHSTTKYINGHSDVVGGVVIAAESELHERLSWWANCIGTTGAPFDSYLTLRGLRTLHARIRQHEENAKAVVDVLCNHAAVTRVHYPGLADHPGHEIARRQQAGYGAMVSFELGGGLAAVETFLSRLECFTLAESLGGVESLVAHPASMTHAAMEPAARRVAGIADTLIRVSVGIEATEDLVNDVRSALDYVARMNAETSPARVAESG